MTTKTQTFRAPHMLAALEAVQRDLGPEALIVSVKQVPGGPAWQVWKKPEVEVVAMASALADSKQDEVSRLAAKIKEMKAKPSATASARAQPAPVAPRASTRTTVDATPTHPHTHTPTHIASSTPWPAPLAAAHRRLLSQGVDEAIARTVADTCTQALAPHMLEDEARVRRHITQQLEAGLTVQNENALAERKVVCLIGTSGAGKTTTAAKLAAHHTKDLGRTVAWVCADTLRTGAISQARIYAETLKLPPRVAYTPEELAQAAAAVSDADLVLVDMPGCNPRREADVLELGAMLTALPRRATLLVAPATAKDADLADAFAAFASFRLTGLVLTKLDETSTFGSVFNAAWRSHLPLVYFTSGPRILDDFQPAQAGLLLNALWNERWTS